MTQSTWHFARSVAAKMTGRTGWCARAFNMFVTQSLNGNQTTLSFPAARCTIYWFHGWNAWFTGGVFFANRRMIATFFLVPPPQEGIQHLFLDGSCSNDKHPVLNLASWSVVNATTGEVVATSILKGVTQTIDRAELTALLQALRWLHGTELEAGIWSDSLSTVQVANHIQQTDHIPDGVTNLDLWTEVQVLLQDRACVRTDVRWIPSHLQSSTSEDPFEDWIIHWNDRADALAIYTNRNRGAAFWRTYESIVSVLDGWSMRLRQLRQFFFCIAEENASSAKSPEEPDDTASDGDDDWLWIPWEDALPLTWQVQTMHSDQKLPGVFLDSIIHWVFAAGRLDGKVRDVSDVELVCLFLLDRAFQFPFSVDGSLRLCMKCPDQMFQRPTLAAILRPTQQAMDHLYGLFPHIVIRTQPQPRPSLGMYMPIKGTRIQIPDPLWLEAKEKLGRFVANRAIRRSNDLARPAPAWPQTGCDCTALLCMQPLETVRAIPV